MIVSVESPTLLCHDPDAIFGSCFISELLPFQDSAILHVENMESIVLSYKLIVGFTCHKFILLETIELDFVLDIL